MNWFAFLTRSKGFWHLFRRMQSVVSRYGLTTTQMRRQLDQLNQILDVNKCSGTFPITAIALKRHPEIIRCMAQRGIEFAVHGYLHIDHSELSEEVQHQHLTQALQVFEKNNIPCYGFRSPYLQWNNGTLKALKNQGLSYVSNEPILWDVLDGQPISPLTLSAYKRVIDFYRAKSADDYFSIPRLVEDFLNIPVALPDDEMLVERLGFDDGTSIGKPWLSILEQTYNRGELFTLSLHPERTKVCYDALSAVLTEARQRRPAVWSRQLDLLRLLLRRRDR